MDLALLDTDLLSELLKQKDSQVVLHAAAYLKQYGQFAFSAFTRYEVIRGLRAKNATTQLAKFETFCQHSLIFPVTDAIFDRTADLWVTARNSGLVTRDADTIIAATTLEHGRVLVTGNTRHFAWIPQLRLADWRQP